MKALILAAGFGTRLLPHTQILPKPLFPVAGRALLDIMVEKLANAGCEEAMVNTHHLHEKIAAHISESDYPIPVRISHEPEILGTGGAMRKVAEFWDERPFLVANSDIITDIDFREVYDFHQRNDCLATLVLVDDPTFNAVSVDADGHVRGFHESGGSGMKLAFTGIQVLDPEALDFIPDAGFSTSIRAYEKMIAAGHKITAFVPEESAWKDLGSPERFAGAVMEIMVGEVFGIRGKQREIGWTALSGDGSDRKWYRATLGNRSLIIADHGIQTTGGPSEVDAYAYIGRHLRARRVPVPEILSHDPFSGLAVVEDLGDENLQTHVRRLNGKDEILNAYKAVIDSLVETALRGAENFDVSRTCQTPRYDRELILEKECRYFVDAFANTCLGLAIDFETLRPEFEFLADRALEHAATGFMHRDMQSRNIMVKNGQFHFIDFQGGRLGPLQYDLASLLIDPYVSLPDDICAELVDHCVQRLSERIETNPSEFETCYRYCRVTRNLQILGAFGFLTRVKAKPWFEQYIPAAIRALKTNIRAVESPRLGQLASLVRNLRNPIQKKNETT